jgi:hypothetical protein
LLQGTFLFEVHKKRKKKSHTKMNGDKHERHYRQ